MIISIHINKALDKIQHPFLMKILNRLGIENNFLGLIKDIYKENLQLALCLNSKRPIKSRTRMSAITLIFSSMHPGGSS